jgi:hypothetical protein
MMMTRAVITGIESKYQNIAELEGTPIGISRVGSGSQTGVRHGPTTRLDYGHTAVQRSVINARIPLDHEDA